MKASDDRGFDRRERRPVAFRLRGPWDDPSTGVASPAAMMMGGLTALLVPVLLIALLVSLIVLSGTRLRWLAVLAGSAALAALAEILIRVAVH